MKIYTCDSKHVHYLVYVYSMAAILLMGAVTAAVGAAASAAASRLFRLFCRRRGGGQGTVAYSSSVGETKGARGLGTRDNSSYNNIARDNP